MTDLVVLREVGLRDGLQNVADLVPTGIKTAWIDREFATGVKEFEVTSLVPARLLPQFSDAEEVVEHTLSITGLQVSALVPNLRGAERGFELGVPKLNYVLSASDAHNQSNVRRSTQESVDDFRQILKMRDQLDTSAPVRISGGIATAFGCTIQGSVDEDRVLQIAVDLLEAGADELLIADTVGYGDPATVKRLLMAVLREAGAIPVGAHFHNTRGQGLANVVAALDAGVRRFDASLGGLGGCPYAPGATGNIVMEDCVFMLERMGVDTGIDLGALLEARELMASRLSEVSFLGEVAKAGLPIDYNSARPPAA